MPSFPVNHRTAWQRHVPFDASYPHPCRILKDSMSRPRWTHAWYVSTTQLRSTVVRNRRSRNNIKANPVVPTTKRLNDRLPNGSTRLYTRLQRLFTFSPAWSGCYIFFPRFGGRSCWIFDLFAINVNTLPYRRVWCYIEPKSRSFSSRAANSTLGLVVYPPADLYFRIHCSSTSS